MDDVYYCLPVINTVIIISCKFRVPYACKIFRGDDDGRGRRPGEKRNKQPTRRRNSDSYLVLEKSRSYFPHFIIAFLIFRFFFFLLFDPPFVFPHTFPLNSPPIKAECFIYATVSLLFSKAT